jgi:hypothetical protein
MEYLLPYAALAALTLLLFFGLRVVIYRLYAHPLAGFPGPKLAAASFLYEFYYDVIKSGMYIWEIERMHEKYGRYTHFFSQFQQIPDPLPGINTSTNNA